MDRIEEIKDSINSRYPDKKLADVIAAKTFLTAIDGGYASSLLGKKAQLGTCTMLKAATTSQQDGRTFGFLPALEEDGKTINKLNIPTIQYKTSKNGILVPIITENGMVASATNNGVFVDCKRISPEDFDLFCLDLRLMSQIKGFSEEQIEGFVKDLKNYSNPVAARLADDGFSATRTIGDAMFKASDICGLVLRVRPASIPTQIVGYRFSSGTFNMYMGMDGNLDISNPNGLKPEIIRAPKEQ